MLRQKLGNAIALAPLAFLLLVAGACGGGSETEPVAPATPDVVELSDDALLAAEAITPETIAEVTQFLASDELEGRAPSSGGDREAQNYIAQRFEALGLQPAAADGSWVQPFELVSITASAPATWEFHQGDQSLSFAHWDEFIAASGVQSPTSEIDNAEVVFVGYGIQAPEYEWDDYKGQDLSGKVLLMMNNDPDWDPELFEGNRRLYYGRWSYKYESAGIQGAAGAIIIHTRPSAGYPYQVVQRSWTGPQFELPAGDEPRTQVAAWMSYDAATRLVAAAGHSLEQLEEQARSRDFQPVPLGLTTSLTLNNQIEKTLSGNVLGLLEGSDPELKDEIVVFTSHHDHLGVGEPNEQGDAIHNGARDNAAGIGQLVAIAEAATKLAERPRRSMLFLAVGAEEQGLLGSKYYAQNPTFPPGKFAANINFDAPGIWGKTRDLPLIGMGKSELDAIASRVAEHQGRVVVGDSDPTQGSYYRSDQFSFAKIGVPALYFGEGTELVGAAPGEAKEMIEDWNLTHYHQPSDEYTDEWNLEGAAQDAQAGFFCGWIVAQQDGMPSWNAGDEFEATRKDALAAVAGMD